MSKASLNRKESRGALIREDFPEEDENLVLNYVFRKGFDPYEVSIGK